MNFHNNYYLNSFFWSTFQKVITAIVGFISVPLLLGYYGKADYGILGIATACNGYMHLLDLGMNTGAVKYFSQWRAKGETITIYHVARTNITFYGIISIINIVGLLALAILGEQLFAVSHKQFLQLRECLFIIAFFSILSWGATTFHQLLMAHMQMAYTMKVQTVMSLLKGLLIGVIFIYDLSLTQYFFLLTAIVSMLIVPYAYKCKKLNLIDSLKPAGYWSEFKVVILFSLSIFALSFFQMTATQSRPIILSVFGINGAENVAEFRIIEVIPQLIIMIGGAFTSIFLPKTSAMVASGNQNEISEFAYKWTKFTTIIVNILTIPFILCAKEVLSAYVGNSYEYLGKWLIIWCVTVLIQIHTTPGNAIILAYGKTKLLVLSTGIFCLLSLLINALLCQYYGVGAAVISYFIYVLLVIGLYYIAYYKKLLKLSRYKMFTAFMLPTSISLIAMAFIFFLPIDIIHIDNQRLAKIVVILLKSSLWFLLYCLLLFVLNVVKTTDLRR